MEFEKNKFKQELDTKLKNFVEVKNDCKEGFSIWLGKDYKLCSHGSLGAAECCRDNFIETISSLWNNDVPVSKPGSVWK